MKFSHNIELFGKFWVEGGEIPGQRSNSFSMKKDVVSAGIAIKLTDYDFGVDIHMSRNFG